MELYVKNLINLLNHLVSVSELCLNGLELQNLLQQFLAI